MFKKFYCYFPSFIPIEKREIFCQLAEIEVEMTEKLFIVVLLSNIAAYTNKYFCEQGILTR